MAERSILFALTGAEAVTGGIASANLNVLRALLALAAGHGLGLAVHSYLESDAARPAWLPPWVRFRGFGARRAAFSRALWRAAAERPLMCFDHVTLALPVLPLAAAGGCRTVVFAHGSESWRRIRRSSIWSFRCAALCLANSSYTLAHMRGRFSGFRGRVCLLGLSPRYALNRTLRPRNGVRPVLEALDGRRRALGERVLLLVARMDPGEGRKGHYALLRVLPALQREFPDLQLVFAGPGAERAGVAAAARAARAEAAVFLPGRVPEALLEALYAHCYAHAMPSRQEGFGLVHLEAMNWGRPCLGCTEDGAADVIIDGETGLLVRDPDDPGELGGRLRWLLANPAEAQRLGRGGHRRLLGEFTAAHAQARVRAHLGGVLGCR